MTLITKKNGIPWLRVAMYILFLTAVVACTEDSYDIEILSYDIATDSYKLQVKSFETLENVNTMSGEATSLIGGTEMKLDYIKKQISWDKVGRPVAFGAIKVDGVYYPEDYNSLAMASIYYSLEQSMLFFESLGMDIDSLGHLETYYWPEVVEVAGDTEVQEQDNAFYMAIDENDRGFYVLPFDSISLLPYSMNQGVMTHEYSHAIFQEVVYDSPDIDMGYLYNSDENYLFALNEGVADIMAVALTGDPDFMTHSNESRYVARDASQMIRYRRSYDLDALLGTGSQFYPYDIGAFLSALMFDIAMRYDGLQTGSGHVPTEATRFLVAENAFNSLVTLSTDSLIGFHVTDYINIFIELSGDRLVKHTCDSLVERYDVHIEDIVGCPQ